MTEKHTPVAYQNKRNGFIAKEDKNPEYNSPLYSSETVEQLEAENAALRKQVEELLRDAWQPIETAPKDGTKVILGRFVEDCHCNKDGFIAVDRWHDCKKGDDYNGWGKFNAAYWPPTHWMCKPDRPAIANEKCL